MPAANRPNVNPAAEARRRIGDQTAAGRLRGRGWLVLSPEQFAELPAAVREHLAPHLSPGTE